MGDLYRTKQRMEGFNKYKKIKKNPNKKKNTETNSRFSSFTCSNLILR